MKKVTFPLLGLYTPAIKSLINELGCEVIVPPKITQETINLGVRHSSDMICFPFKVTLSSLIKALDAGADTIVVSGVTNKSYPEPCRFLYYYHIQEQILRRLGYEFEMHYISFDKSFLKSIKNINPNNSYLKIIRLLNKFYKRIKQIDNEHHKFEKKKINIGVVGEFYALLEPDMNYDIINKLKAMDVGVDLSLPLSWWLKYKLHLSDKKKHLIHETKKYFPKRTMGHGWESLINTIDYAKKGFDGVIHLMPLSCSPESLVEMSLNQISEDYNIPIYRFPLDENKFEVGFDTRLETFIKILKRNKGCL